jgi:EmrB/QacA subfamily drug resistance transporter
MSPHTSAQHHPQRHPQRWWILGALSLSLMVLGVDTTVLTVAVPVLTQDLAASTTDLQWILDSYILVLAAFLLPAGSLGDRIGRKRVLVTGLTLFLAGSLLCARATSAGALIGSRAFMGLGGALTLPLTLSVLPTIFSEEERPRALAVWSVNSGVSISLGPIVGGWLLDHFFWGSIFLFNVPFIVTALAAVIWLVPESRDERRRRVDPLGVLLTAAGLISLVYAIIEQPVRGWDWVTLGAVTAGVVLLVVMVAWEARSSHPMLNVRLFANPRFTWATIGIALIGMVASGAMFLITQLLQDVEGYRPFGAGLRMLPMVAGLLAGSQTAGRLLPRIGTKLAMSGGYALVAAGLALFSTASVTTGYGFMALCLALIGTGLGAAMTPGLDSIMGAMPEGEFGAGSALANTFRQVGGAIGVAVLGDIYLSRYVAALSLPHGLPAQVVSAARQSVGAANSVADKLPPAAAARVLGQAHAAFVSGFDLTLVIAAGVAMLAAALVIALLPARKPRSPDYV